MDRHKKSFLKDYNICREVKAYLLGGATVIPFLIGINQLYPNISPQNTVTNV